ncbi:MAG: argininosuccinate synthase [archaeon YNP-WB-062]|jgi:argininosuccinate synthase|nr:argininosuccinate synthase [Candidatus Culexarchaeum yellowstonense]MCS7367874.1 argininosuccinate synthase [Candidatus Culexarchaeum yellowstonense]
MKVVLAYSGGLDTTVLLKILQEKYNAEVITLTLNLGQEKDYEEVEERALKAGSIKHYNIDARDEFVNDYVLPALKANALYQQKYPVSSAISRPLIAKKLVEVAEREGADAVAHGCTGKGNDQIRFDVTIKAINPNIKVIAPVRELGLTRDWEIEYAKKKGLPVKISESPYSIDENIWGRSIECGVLEDPYQEPPEEIFKMTVNPKNAPENPEIIEMAFNNGIPTKINGETMKPKELIMKLNEIGGKHGIGRIDHIEDRVVGLKSREVYEAPAALIAIEAHKDLEKMTLTTQELQFKRLVDDEWTNLVYAGLWMNPLRKALEAFINETQKRVNGEVKVKLYKGGMICIGRRSEYSIYNKELATYEAWSKFNQKMAEGFIEIWGMQTVIANKKLKIHGGS